MRDSSDQPCRLAENIGLSHIVQHDNRQETRHGRQLQTYHQQGTPNAAGGSNYGNIFAILYSTSYFLILHRAPGSSADIATWLARDSETISTGISLLPFAGIAFLWFMGVVRDALGHLEDQFFSTLFFGSGLLYLAMTFMSAALAERVGGK